MKLEEDKSIRLILVMSVLGKESDMNINVLHVNLFRVQARNFIGQDCENFFNT